MIRIPKHHLEAQPAPDSEPLRIAITYQHWWTTGYCPTMHHEVVLYHGPELESAQQAKRDAELHGFVYVAIKDGGCVYPRPDIAPGCLCKGYSLRSLRCAFGHENECHFPATCVEADCAYVASIEDASDEVTDAMERRGLILATDKFFAVRAEVGDLACVCSRCGRLCSEEPVRINDADSESDEGEWRYCEECFT